MDSGLEPNVTLRHSRQDSSSDSACSNSAVLQFQKVKRRHSSEAAGKQVLSPALGEADQKNPAPRWKSREAKLPDVSRTAVGKGSSVHLPSSPLSGCHL